MRQLTIFCLLLILTTVSFAQGGVGVNSNGAMPDTSAMLDISSTVSGVLIPRMTQAQRDAISGPAHSLMIYQTNNDSGYYYYDANGSEWISLLQTLSISGDTLSLSNGNAVALSSSSSISCVGYDNLVVASITSSTLSITADKLCVGDKILNNVNDTVDITVSGAGGLDGGSEAANTWYYVFVITNATGNNINVLLSTSSTAPTLPTGFTQFRRVGAVRNNGSNNFLPFDQEGREVAYHTGYTALSLGQATSWTDVSLASFLPPTSQKAYCESILTITHNVMFSGFFSYLKKKGTSSAGTMRVAMTYGNNATYAKYPRVIGNVATDNNQTIQYYINAVPSNSGGVSVVVFGYYDRL